ncbi:30S ribosomal protein S3 [candidate division MSBL1 archaeon SCGC-AAA259I09]|uniref:Small ribosomal subunit protein uS3 n=2 Tax=candidate division MSBL1 TaxID=215777 RepID=A0A133UQH6_9EURY|nr:30S ribosomal protein S3 [candidate division MSBL1 archaeon SCGC-AAA259D14]KXA96512.1 30S ribosomal protein S3 [candidate division MSBL1 archaeon SCGC-AAA259I09]
MSVEEVFIQKGLDRAKLEEFLEEELEAAGYGGMDIRRTPMGTRVTLYVERPGVVIGRGGRSIQELTDKLGERFGLENPQVEVSEIEVPEFNASIMANRVAFLLTRGVYFRRAGYGALREIMDAGARGVEILISGKLTGDYAREERFYDGYLKKAGELASELVSTGQAVAELPAGTVGVKVRIMPPGAEIPGQVEGEPEEKEKREKPKPKEKLNRE